MNVETVTVELGSRRYPVVIAPGLAGLGRAVAERTSRRAVLVTESTVGPLWADAVGAELAGAGIAVKRLCLPAGEANKTVATWASCVDGLLAAGVDRHTVVVALGGGVLGDIAGFAASAALRGLPLVQVPTTLLAMVDSSVGGKTAVNHASGKNLIGAFYQPRLVWAALQTLGTLPRADRIAGLGEVLKIALVADADLLAHLEEVAEDLRDGHPAVLGPVVARCVSLKAEVVARDELESGWRAVLNAGHTVGHGYETALGHGALRHGEAVAIGLIEEARWAARRGVCTDPGLPARLAVLADRLGLPTAAPRVDPARVFAAMGVDKKLRGDILRLPVPVCAGRMKLVELPLSALSELLLERS